MKKIGKILQDKPIYRSEIKRPQNKLWEEAQEFGDYVGLKTTFVLMLFKKFGKPRVLSLRSYLKDIPNKGSRFTGLVIWKLNQPAP